MAAIADSTTTALPQLQALQDAARATMSSFRFIRSPDREEIGAAIDAAKASGAAAVNVLASPVLFGNRQIVMQRVATLRMPAIYQFPEVARDGGFIAYGPRLLPIFGELVTRQLVKLLAWHQPRGCASGATDQVRSGDQPQDRQGARAHNPEDHC